MTSIGVHLLFLIPPYWLDFNEDRFFRLPPEIWRLITSFLLTSPKIGLIMDPYFSESLLQDRRMEENDELTRALQQPTNT